MDSSVSSTPNHDYFAEDGVRSELETLKKLYTLLHPNNDLNAPGTSDQTLDDKSRVFLMKLLDEATQQTLRRQANILPSRTITPPSENPSSSRISDEKREFQHGYLKPKTIYSPVPSFQRNNSNRFKSQFSIKSHHNQPYQNVYDQSRIGNRAPISRSIISPNRISKSNEKHKEKLLSGYNTAEPVHKRTQLTNRNKILSSRSSGQSKTRNYNKMKGNKIRPIEKFEEKEKRAPQVRRQISNKKKLKEVLSDSNSSSNCESCSSRTAGSLEKGPIGKPKSFAKRPENTKKFSKSPSPSQRNSKSPMNQPKMMPSHHDHDSKALNKMLSHHDHKALIKVSSHDNKTLNNMPSHHDNKALIKVPNHDNKTLIKLPSHNNSKALIKIPSHNNKRALTKMPSHNNNKALIKMPSHNNKALIKMPSHRSKAPSHHSKVPSHHKEVRKPKNPKECTKKNHEKSPEKKNDNKKKESGFKNIKHKLAVVFHHHHHHHHHHEEGTVPAQHHRSPWKFLKGMVHRSSERAVEIAPAQHHHHLRQLFRAMMSHLWRKNNKNGRKKKKNKGAKLGNKGRKKLHWWNKWKKGCGVKLTNGKKARRLKVGWRKGSGKKKGGKR